MNGTYYFTRPCGMRVCWWLESHSLYFFFPPACCGRTPDDPSDAVAANNSSRCHRASLSTSGGSGSVVAQCATAFLVLRRQIGKHSYYLLLSSYLGLVKQKTKTMMTHRVCVRPVARELLCCDDDVVNVLTIVVTRDHYVHGRVGTL